MVIRSINCYESLLPLMNQDVGDGRLARRLQLAADRGIAGFQILKFLAAGGVVRLRVTVAWSPWGDVGTTEHGFLEEALRALPAAGFTVEPSG